MRLVMLRPACTVCTRSNALQSISRKCFARGLTTNLQNRFDAAVIGAGPGGLTCVSNLLAQGLKRVALIDPSFTGGRIHEKYREVPSNTKTKMFDAWAAGTEVSRRILAERTKRGEDAYKHLQSLDPEQGCSLGEAVDVAQMLSRGFCEDARVKPIKASVTQLQRNGDGYVLPELGVSAERVVLATGSHPRSTDKALLERHPHLIELPLDLALKPSLLKTSLSTPSTVALIGSSHSGILALKNLYEQGHRVYNFYRSPLLHAEYKEGWILWDNTGLKGVASDWAKATLEDESRLPSNIKRIPLKTLDDKGKTHNEADIYDRWLKDCTHIVSATGYVGNPIPSITVDGEQVKPSFDPLSGRFLNEHKQALPGLFGSGIAYPERVTDPEGHSSSNVGWFKFQKFVGRVAPEWVARP
ncbi:pyridine nucleotide-disulfide oxidoreductase-domain-containing protein [Protomyces lactucae-debilis]|uniref:Pyridine nucleotide-disulfide oxidoreductase-domain-containing protein n=1 Tax=Protomyces lactucae-debilis TaxID=2754530 RepID=A0A1Y2FW89_PROLT|nr:pyridine nucleotide-disulfide oxidoreductase-domain-containing protein [Protomyces lactucae-debilis]ORY87564.1 pyridine nucleotide-disulfide oxidoreductase-domain-containing protein [Protomyces lactucae-debilis]